MTTASSKQYVTKTPDIYVPARDNDLESVLEELRLACVPQVVTVSDTAYTLTPADNTVYNAGGLTSLTITPAASYGPEMTAQLNFTSGQTPTAVTAPNGLIWLGDDIVAGMFVPGQQVRYCVMFQYDGNSLRATVQGA